MGARAAAQAQYRIILQPDPADELECDFIQAVDYIKKLSCRPKVTVSTEQQLHFYAHYKQATQGPNGTPQPFCLDAGRSSRWKAWASLGNMDAREAMRGYCATLSDIDPGWNSEVQFTTGNKYTQKVLPDHKLSKGDTARSPAHGNIEAEGSMYTFGNEPSLPSCPTIRNDPEGECAKLVGCLMDDKICQSDISSPLPLPPGLGLKWCKCDLLDENVIEEVRTFLWDHYVDDGAGGKGFGYRFAYSREFLQWDLASHGFSNPDWILGIRQSGKLVGFIAGTPIRVRLGKFGEQPVECCEINFFCLHPSLRSCELPGANMARLAVNEITRRVVLSGTKIAFYTGGAVLPDCFATARYYHRIFNYRKLIQCGFTSKPGHLRHMTLDGFLASNHASPPPKEWEMPGTRPFEEKDADECLRLLTLQQEPLGFCREWTREEVAHVLDCPGVVAAFVVEHPEQDGRITDFFSFYSLPSTVLLDGEPWEGGQVNASFLFYSVATSVAFPRLLEAATLQAFEMGFDNMTALSVGSERADCLSRSVAGYRLGTGSLRFYMFNVILPILSEDQLGFIAL